jgi:hypothetical protein
MERDRHVRPHHCQGRKNDQVIRCKKNHAKKVEKPPFFVKKLFVNFFVPSRDDLEDPPLGTFQMEVVDPNDAKKSGSFRDERKCIGEVQQTRGGG